MQKLFIFNHFSRTKQRTLDAELDKKKILTITKAVEHDKMQQNNK